MVKLLLFLEAVGLQQDYTEGPMVVLGGVGGSYERGTPEAILFLEAVGLDGVEQLLPVREPVHLLHVLRRAIHFRK